MVGLSNQLKPLDTNGQILGLFVSSRTWKRGSHGFHISTLMSVCTCCGEDSVNHQR